MSAFKLVGLVLWWQIVSVIAASFRDSTPLFKDSKYVKTLTSETFNQMLNNPNEVWVVDFYAPWCPHCRDFAPEYEKIAIHYGTSKIVRTGAIDCTVNEVICTAEEIMAYPVVKVFHVPPTATKGKRYTQMRHKTMKSIIKWIEDVLDEANLMSGVRNVADVDSELNTFQNDGDDQLLEESHQVKYARLQDAGSAAIFTLEHSLFIGTTILDSERYKAAVQWIEALAATFPLEQNRAVFRDLAQAVKQRERWDPSGWKSLLDKWKNLAKATTFPKSLLVYDEDATWAHCNTYTCGLWTLFHSMSVEAGSPLCTLRPSEVAAAIRLFVMHFFGCEECVRHFLRANPEHVIIELANADANRNNALVMWLWKMHNRVNKVTKKQFWPLPQTCPKCFTQPIVNPTLEPALLDEEAIVEFVTHAYQQSDADVWKMNLQNNGVGAVLTESFSGFWVVGIVVMAFFALLALSQNKTTFAFLKREHAA